MFFQTFWRKYVGIHKKFTQNCLIKVWQSMRQFVGNFSHRELRCSFFFTYYIRIKMISRGTIFQVYLLFSQPTLFLLPTNALYWNWSSLDSLLHNEVSISHRLRIITLHWGAAFFIPGKTVEPRDKISMNYFSAPPSLNLTWVVSD